jgi:hypothetical protein
VLKVTLNIHKFFPETLPDIAKIALKFVPDTTAMSTSPSSRQPMGPLSVGNVVSAGLRLYRDHFKSYFGVAFRATLWALLPFLVLIPIPLLLIGGKPNLATVSLLIPLGIVLFFYGMAKYTANSALISRLAFGELVNKHESTQEASSQVNRKFWIFFRTFFLYFLISCGLVLGFYILVALIGFIGAFVAAFVRENIAAIVIIVLLGITAFAVSLSALIRSFTRFFMFEVPLAIEENIKATQTIRRSWDLTKGHVGRIFLILTIAFFVTFPLYIVAQIGVKIVQEFMIKLVEVNPLDINFQLLLFLVAYVLGLVVGAVFLPFWQAIKAVIYYDLRTRREGLALQLRDWQSQ